MTDATPLQVGDVVVIVALNGIPPTLVGRQGKITGFPDANRVTVEFPKWFVGNFRRVAVRKHG